MVKREKYLKKIRPFYNETSLIKIIYGLRRSGKSVILSQIVDELKEKGIDDEHIININFESLDYDNIKNCKDLDKYVKSCVKDKKVYYVFLDEIQEVEEFEKGINSLRIENQFSIFITGSNSRMTFAELSTILSGRYVSFKVYPLSFEEVVDITNSSRNDYSDLLFDIFKNGSLPQRFSLKDDESISSYILDVYNSIILRDIVDKIGIKDINAFNKILQYLLETEGREFSATNIIEYLEKENVTISTQTLYQYLDALCNAFILNKVYRYDIVGKEVLKTLNKFYVSDLGIKRIKSNNKDINYSISLENIVYNNLLFKGYNVYIGKTKKGEIDFIAEKDGDKKYVQVAYELKKEETREREYSAFDSIDDGYSKYIISTDKENYSYNGIKNVNIFDFLLDDDF